MVDAQHRIERAHDWLGPTPTDGPETFLAAVSLLRCVPYILVYGIGAAVSMGFAHNAIALVCVGLVCSSPRVMANEPGLR